MSEAKPTGVLLVNLGSPDSPEPRDVRRYLAEFLSDPRVLTMPAALRWLLLRGVILPFRPRRSAHAYSAIWTEDGSPLLVHSRALHAGVAEALGSGYHVELAMRYGQPSLDGALLRLAVAGVPRLVVIPLFPQYARSTTDSVRARALECAGGHWPEGDITTVESFYDHPGFIAAIEAVARPAFEAFAPDHVLMSYHGLPESHVRREDASGKHCLARDTCCDAVGEANARCYRAHCYATSRAIAAAFRLEPEEYTVAFQSRLGPARWIGPATDRTLGALAARGIERLAVLCPSFVCDCLETLEEIGIRGRAQWLEAGGRDFQLVPCVNAHPVWVRGLAGLVREIADAG